MTQQRHKLHKHCSAIIYAVTFLHSIMIISSLSA